MLFPVMKKLATESKVDDQILGVYIFRAPGNISTSPAR
jgi:hypothetical protein